MELACCLITYGVIDGAREIMSMSLDVSYLMDIIYNESHHAKPYTHCLLFADISRS